jgi:hypothetical protein
VVKLGADAVDIELRAWTDYGEKWTQIRSELAIAVSKALTGANVALR